MTAQAAYASDTIVDGLTREDHEAELEHRYPKALIWYGVFTLKWWAIVTDALGTARQLSANDPFTLADMLDAARIVLPPAFPPSPGHERRLLDTYRAPRR